MALVWALLFALISVNALYVAAEFATVAARSTTVKKMANDGDKIAARLLTILETPQSLDEYIASCQIGITISSLVLGAYSQIALGPAWTDAFISYGGMPSGYAESTAAILILSIFTFLQILLGELLPKSIALEYSDRIALLMYWPLRISTALYRPFIWLLNGSGNLIMKMIGISPSSHKHIHSLEEISLLLADSRDGGLLEPDEHERLQHALELTEKTARQLMTPRTRLDAITIETEFDELYKKALKSPYTRLVAYGETIDDVRGVIDVKEVIGAKFAGKPINAESLVKQVPIVPENLSLADLIKLLRSRHSQIAVVMDEHGANLGIVTVGDILAEMMDDVEIDEFKQPEEIEVLEDGRIRIPGAYKVHRAVKLLGEIPESNADTVNGLILELLGRVPEKGDQVELKQTTLSVEEVDHNAASLVFIRKKEGDK